MAPRQLLSIVVPCYNEEAVLPELYRRLDGVLQDVGDMDSELVFVDDGSHDATPQMLANLHQTDPRVRMIRFSRNFGHQIAVTAGLEHARGDAVVVLDADLQHSPEVIHQMLREWA